MNQGKSTTSCGNHWRNFGKTRSLGRCHPEHLEDRPVDQASPVLLDDDNASLVENKQTVHGSTFFFGYLSFLSSSFKKKRKEPKKNKGKRKKLAARCVKV